MKAERIVDGVYRILKGYVNAYAIEADDGLTVIDTGTPKGGKRLVEAIADLPEVRSVLLTHHHHDHIGGLAALAGRAGLTVYAPAGDAPIIRGERLRPGPNPAVGWTRILGRAVVRFAPAFEPRTVDVEVAGGHDLPIAGGIAVIDTPGHTLGHVSFLLRRAGGTLFAGDAAGALGSKVGPPVSGPFAMFTEDLGKARESFRALAAMEFEAAVFGHGKPVRSGAADAFRRGLERLKG